MGDVSDRAPRWRIGCATAILGTHILVAGGYEDDEPGPKRYERIPKSSAYMLDLVTGECEWLDDLPLSPNDSCDARRVPMRTSCAGCVSPDGRHFVVSGGEAMTRHVEHDDDDDDGGKTWSLRSSCTAWNFSRGVWEEMPPMTVPRSHHKLVAAGGHLVALGGRTDTPCDEASAELFDEAAGRWLKLPLNELPNGDKVCL